MNAFHFAFPQGDFAFPPEPPKVQGKFPQGLSVATKVQSSYRPVLCIFAGLQLVFCGKDSTADLLAHDYRTSVSAENFAVTIGLS